MKKISVFILCIICFTTQTFAYSNYNKPNILQEQYKLPNGETCTLFIIEDNKHRTVINETNQGIIYRSTFYKKTNIIHSERLTINEQVKTKTDLLNDDFSNLDKLYNAKTITFHEINTENNFGKRKKRSIIEEPESIEYDGYKCICLPNGRKTLAYFLRNVDETYKTPILHYGRTQDDKVIKKCNMYYRNIEDMQYTAERGLANAYGSVPEASFISTFLAEVEHYHVNKYNPNNANTADSFLTHIKAIPVLGNCLCLADAVTCGMTVLAFKYNLDDIFDRVKELASDL